MYIGEGRCKDQRDKVDEEEEADGGRRGDGRGGEDGGILMEDERAVIGKLAPLTVCRHGEI
eukprot:4116552-Pyramimonas_sp.AAC.1